jgi:hypothetical protein
MATLTLNIKNQTLSVQCDFDRIVENSINYLNYKIESSSDWAGYTTQVIVTCQSGTYRIPGEKIPNYVLLSPGFSIGVIGIISSDGFDNDGNPIKPIDCRITTNPVFIQVHPSCAMEAIKAPSREELALEWAEAIEESIKELQEIAGLSESAKGIYKRLEKVEEEVESVNNTLDEHTTNISENASEIQTNKDNIEKNASDIIKNAEEIGNHTKTLIEQSQNIENNSTAIQEINNTRLAVQVKNNILYIDYFKNIEQKEG